MAKCVIYTRVSTTEQANQGYSLQRQKKECLEFAKKNGYEVVEVFEERGESAKTTDRTELKSMMEFCTQPEKKDIKALILWKIDRLARNMEDYYFLNDFFNKLGITTYVEFEKISDTNVEIPNTGSGSIMPCILILGLFSSIICIGSYFSKKKINN